MDSPSDTMRFNGPRFCAYAILSLLAFALPQKTFVKAQNAALKTGGEVQTTEGDSATQESGLTEEEKREKLMADRFLQVLLRRPNQGTSLDRVFGYHIGQGTIGELIEQLTTTAKQSADADESGNHWMVVGLLQLQRGEDAAAIDAFAEAEKRLPKNPLAAYFHGQAFLLVGQTDNAAQAMQRALDLRPPKQDFLKIAGQLGRLYQRSGNVEEALGIWKQLEQAFPGDDGVRQRIARITLEEGDIPGAVERYDALAKEARSPNDKIIYALRAADLRAKMGNKEQAITQFEKLLSKLRPGSYLHDEARRRIESTFLDSGDYAGLADYYEKWIGDHPEDVNAVVRLARTLSVQGRSAEALNWFEKAIEKAPSDGGPRVELVNAYIAQGKFQDAIDQYEELVRIEPNNPDHFVRWGQAILENTEQSKEERKQAAAKVWQKLAKSRSDDAVVQSQVADLLREAELSDLAIESYRKAITLAPEDPQYKEYLGEYLHQLERKEEAMEVWRSLAAGDLRNRKNLIRLAEVLNQFESRDEALATMSDACELDPTIEDRLRYAEWLREAEKYSDALEQVSLASKAAENFDEQERIFAAELKTYQESGKLADRIDEAIADAEKNSGDAERQRRLAVLLNAAGRTPEALEAIEESLKIAPTSIEALAIAARMYEDSGRLKLAVEKRRKLAESDRRFRNGHLQRLSSLYLRVGETEQAIDVGRELLAASAGAIDAFRFYADLCGKIGRLDERLDTLRRCARLNPRSNEAQEMLANQLAADFKTDQAIELYWKMLEGSGDLEDRRATARTLADLYLRTNRLDQLITRLEIRGRESGDRRATVDLISTVHEQAGDLGLARQELEGLLREGGRDTMLLERLVALAEQSGEYDEAVALQRQLTQIAPDRKNEARLASLLVDIGELDEAQAMWLRMTEAKSDKALTSRHINRLFGAGEIDAAIKLTEGVLEKDSEDWESRLKLMVLHADQGEWEKAAAEAKALMSLQLDDTTLPEGGKPYQQTVTTASGQSYTQPPLQLARTQNLYEFYRIVDERYGYQSTASLPKPIDLGQARLMAFYCDLKHRSQEGEDINKILDSLKQAAMAEDATAELAWKWYQAVSIAASVTQTNTLSPQNPNEWDPIWRLSELDPELGSMILVGMFFNRSSYAQRGGIEMQNLPEDRMKWLKAKAETADEDPRDNYGRTVSWPQLYASELRISGDDEMADTFLSEMVKKAIENPDDSKLGNAVQQAASYSTDEVLWPLIKKSLEQRAASPNANRVGRASGLLSMFSAKKRVDDDLSKGTSDKKYRERIIELTGHVIQDESEKPLQRKMIRLTGIGGPRTLGRMVGQRYERITIDFPPTGLGPDNTFVFAFYNAWESMRDHSDEWITSLASDTAQTSEPRLAISQHLTLAMLQFWNKNLEAALGEVQKATSLAAENLPQLEPELSLMSADLLLRLDRKADALKAIDALAVYDQRTMAVREFAAARLAAAIGDRDRAQSAARRLFGVRLGTEAQIELAKMMRKLEMRELASDLVRRMRNRGGSNNDQLQALMTYFIAQGESEQAAEVAMELLRRSVPTRRMSSNSVTANQALRRNAMQTLATTGRLTALIKRTETRLKNAPKSQRVRSELAEMYLAAGQTEKSQELLGQTDLKDVNSTRALAATAKQLVTAGKMEEACDAYLKYLKRKQDNFSQDFYDIKRPFDSTQRLGDLADLMIEVGIEKFTDYRVAEICEDLLRNEDNTPKARALYSAMLDRPPTSSNAMYSMSNIMGSARKLLTDREVVMRTADFMIQASANTNDWNGLFSGYSTSSDGRHNNVTTYFVRYVSENKENAQEVVDAIREKLDEKDDWHAGKIWLALMLTKQEQFEEAESLIKPILEKDQKLKPTHDLLWLVGSLIDAHEPMHDLAEEVYEYALENTSDTSSRDFKYSLKGRICNFMADIGNNRKAREMALIGFQKEKEKPSNNYGNAEYEAYQQIRSTLSMMDFLSQIEYPSDALRIAREFDQSLFAKAGRYQRGRKEEFERKEKELLDKVRELGGLEVVRSMINDKAEGGSAVDFGITFGDRPISQQAVSSLWVEMLEQIAMEEQRDEDVQSFAEDMRQLAESRPEDESAKVASVLAADIAGKREPLRELIRRWTDTSDSVVKPSNPRNHNRLLILCLLRFDRAANGTEAESDRAMVATFDITSIEDLRKVDASVYLAALADQAFERDDEARGTELLERIVTLASNQWILLDLSQAAIESGMEALSSSAFAAAVKAPTGQIQEPNLAATSAGSLGQLLSSAQPRRSSSNSSRQDELDPEEVRLAQRILELDEAWRVKKLYTKFVYDPLVELTLGATGKRARTLCTPIEVKANDRLVVQSVFDRLARRASWSKRTDKLLGRLDDDDAETHLLASLALLYANRADEALERLKAIDASALSAIPKEIVIQVLLKATEHPVCSEQAVILGLSLVDQNKPTQRYADIDPFDTFSLHLAKTSLNEGLNQEYVARSINSYLELCAHDNDRYSGLSSRMTRRVSQLEKVAQLLLPKGKTDDAMTYLGLRNTAFAQGFDRGNDWVGSWALESIQGMSDRKAAYQKLADWTFTGDGPLQSIRTLVRRDPLPTWIPPDVAGYYPPFPPVPERSLPIATNYYSLVRLAQLTDKTDDLRGRLENALKADRSGADVAMAIYLATTSEAPDPKLLQQIEKRLDAIQPGSGSPKSAAPLAEMQLASMLAGSADHDRFAKKVTERLGPHTHQQSRGYLSPWIERFRHQQGWSETSAWKSTDELSHWIRSNHSSAKDYSEGMTPPIWVTDEKSRIDHICGFGNDYLWFRYPVEGNFTVECETSDGNWSESELVYGALRFSALGNSSSVYLKTQGTNDWLRFNSKGPKKNEWNHCSITLDDKNLSYRVNDVLIYQEKRKTGTPWIALHAEGNKTTRIRNIKVSGSPEIPREVNLIPEDSLRGWSGRYLGAKLPTADVNITVREKGAEKANRYRSAPKPDRIANLAWTVKDGELISGNLKQQSYNGQNSIRYERPLGDGESLTYEFYYEVGKTEVHPSIGRIAYLFRPEGLKFHLMAAPNTPWNIPKGFEVPAPGIKAEPLSLREGDWNQVELKRSGNQVQISLNGKTVFDQEPQSRLGDMVFGLYHNRETTKARVRNVVLRGPWPTEVPENLFER